MYPALAVLQALKGDSVNSELDTLWVGSAGGMEADIVQRAGIPYKEIPAAGLHGVGLRRLPGNINKLLRGTLASRQILQKFDPDVLLFTGGYVAAPMAVANRNRPILLFVPDIEPGMALKFISRFATCITVTTEASRGYYAKNKNVVVTGYPTRSELEQWTKDCGRSALGLQRDLPVLLVFGGSKGARSINQALFNALPRLLNINSPFYRSIKTRGNLQIIHITGQLDWPEVRNVLTGLSHEQASRYHAYPYLHEEMGAALAAADLVISRAGASILGEYPLLGLPAILVPYPYAWRYQRGNAAYLEKKGAAVTLEDGKLHDQIFTLTSDLLCSPEKLAEMREAMQSLNCPGASRRIGSIAQDLANRRSIKG